MDWNKALELELITLKAACRLIIVGESKDGQPFCYEENFRIEKIDESSFSVWLELPGVYPFEKLEHVSFIEFSFSDRGLLYFTYLDLISLELKKTGCLLTLSIPDDILMQQKRHFNRVKLPSRTPVTLQIVGIRRLSARKGVAFTGLLLDISAGGLSFVTANRLFPPLLLEFSFMLPYSPHPITVCGEIIRVTSFSHDSYRIAAKFRNTPEMILNEIEKYCSKEIS